MRYVKSIKSLLNIWKLIKTIFILKVDETPTSIGGELSNSSWWAFQSPSKIKPPADGRDARMNFVVQSTTRISPKSAGADLNT